MDKDHTRAKERRHEGGYSRAQVRGVVRPGCSEGERRCHGQCGDRPRRWGRDVLLSGGRQHGGARSAEFT